VIISAAACVQKEISYGSARARIKADLCQITNMPVALHTFNWIVDARFLRGVFDPKGDSKVNRSLAIARARVAVLRCQNPESNKMILLPGVSFDSSRLRRVLKSSWFSSALAQTVAKLLQDVSALPTMRGRCFRKVDSESCNMRCPLFDDNSWIVWKQQLLPNSQSCIGSRWDSLL
jgi:hypothetical protein